MTSQRAVPVLAGVAVLASLAAIAPLGSAVCLFLGGVAIMVAFLRTAQRVEPFTRRG